MAEASQWRRIIVVLDLIKRLGPLRYRVYAGLFYASGIALLSLMLLTVADVTGRYVFNNPISGTIEISQQMMAFIILLGLAFTLVKGVHVSVGLVFDRLPRRLQILARVVADITGLCLCVLLTWGSWVQFWDSWIVGEWMPAAVRIPWWPAKLVMPIGFCFMSIEFFIRLLSRFIELAGLDKNYTGGLK